MKYYTRIKKQKAWVVLFFMEVREILMGIIRSLQAEAHK